MQCVIVLWHNLQPTAHNQRPTAHNLNVLMRLSRSTDNQYLPLRLAWDSFRMASVHREAPGYRSDRSCDWTLSCKHRNTEEESLTGMGVWGKVLGAGCRKEPTTTVLQLAALVGTQGHKACQWRTAAGQPVSTLAHTLTIMFPTLGVQAGP